MSHLAVINKLTKLVENIIVKPEGANVWFVADGYDAIETGHAKIGDSYINGEFIPAEPEAQPE